MLPYSVDILVIGAGVLGATVAYYLSQQGIQVLVVDKKEVASGASGSNLGQISLVDREQGTELDLAIQSLNIYSKLQGEWLSDSGYKRTGGLYLLDEEDDLQEINNIVRQKKDYLDCSLLTGLEIREQEPFINTNIITGAVYCPDEGKLDPFQVTLGFMDAARANGVNLLTNVDITGFKVNGNKIVEVKTNKGTIKAKEVIMATGAWTRRLLNFIELDLPIHYHRGAAMVTQPIPPVINGPIVPGRFLTKSIDYDGSVFIGAVQQPNGSVIIAQANDVVSNFDVSVTYAGINKMANMFLDYFPRMKGVNVIRAWAGVTTYTDDGLPFFGYCKKVENLFLVAGFKGAFTVAPAVGKMAAEKICTGHSTIDDKSRFSPQRYQQ